MFPCGTIETTSLRIVMIERLLKLNLENDSLYVPDESDMEMFKELTSLRLVMSSMYVFADGRSTRVG